MTSIVIVASASAALLIARKKIEFESRKQWRKATTVKTDCPIKHGAPIILDSFPGRMHRLRWRTIQHPDGVLINKTREVSSDDSSCSPISDITEVADDDYLDDYIEGIVDGKDNNKSIDGTVKEMNDNSVDIEEENGYSSD